MIGIGSNDKALVTIAALASILIVNAIAIGTDGHIALARHYENTQVYKNSNINIQTDTNQGQACETAGGTSPISGSCTTSSSNTISQGTSPASTSPCTPTMHPTRLTLTATSPSPGAAALTGTLTDTCTGSGVPGLITFTGFPFTPPGVFTDAAGSYSLGPFGVSPGTYTIQAHFAGNRIFEPSNAAAEVRVE